MDSSGGVSVIEPVDSNVSSEAEETAVETLDRADFFFLSFLAGFDGTFEDDEREDEVVKVDTVALPDDPVVDKALAVVVEGRSVVIL